MKLQCNKAWTASATAEWSTVSRTGAAMRLACISTGLWIWDTAPPGAITGPGGSGAAACMSTLVVYVLWHWSVPLQIVAYVPSMPIDCALCLRSSYGDLCPTWYALHTVLASCRYSTSTWCAGWEASHTSSSAESPIALRVLLLGPTAASAPSDMLGSIPVCSSAVTMSSS